MLDGFPSVVSALGRQRSVVDLIGLLRMRDAEQPVRFLGAFFMVDEAGGGCCDFERLLLLVLWLEWICTRAAAVSHCASLGDVAVRVCGECKGMADARILGVALIGIADTFARRNKQYWVFILSPRLHLMNVEVAFCHGIRCF